MFNKRFMRCKNEVRHLGAWAREAGLNYSTLCSRVKAWGGGCKAVITPLSLAHAEGARKRVKTLAARRIVRIKGRWILRGNL